jgi:hypothetical protein
MSEELEVAATRTTCPALGLRVTLKQASSVHQSNIKTPATISKAETTNESD